MACKQGIRKSIEASRTYHQSLKTYDPVHELWKSLVERCSSEPSLRDWSDQERNYFSVYLLEGEIYNGGFDQYFHNSSGDYYRYALSGLEEIGASYSLTILREATELLFGNDGPSADQADRWRMMEQKHRRFERLAMKPEWSVRLEELDRRFCKDPDQLGDLLNAYAEEHRLISPFGK